MKKIILPVSPVSLILPVSPVVTPLILSGHNNVAPVSQVSPVAAIIAQINRAFDARIAYEVEKSADARILENAKKQLNSSRSGLTHEAIATVLLNAKFSPDCINGKLRDNAAMNLKAIVKIENTARSIASVETLNVYTNAILKTLKTFEENEQVLTRSDTVACCSSNGKLSDAKRNKLLSRTAKHYAPGTASTQASSSNRVLLAFDVIRETKNAANEVCYVLNNSNETTALLLARTY